jgi:hypothetical protein
MDPFGDALRANGGKLEFVSRVLSYHFLASLVVAESCQWDAARREVL